jgi:alpha-glucosidase
VLAGPIHYMLRILAFLSLLILPHVQAIAQDERRVTSPNGQLEFRLTTAQQESSALHRLAYWIFYRGKPLIDTSFLGLNIRFQEPLLGENDGLMSSKMSSTGSYNSLVAEYLQNGSLGRRINVEVRAANDGIAFRYVIPQSTPLMELLLEDETTEFAFAQDGKSYPADRPAGVDLSRVDAQARLALPFVVKQADAWIAIDEVANSKYPRTYLARSDGNIFVTRLAPRPNDPGVVYEGATPLTCPWRVVIVGSDRDRLLQSEIFKSLKN